jgi:hypothetical protein
MENFPKKRGRPRKIPEPMVPEMPEATREVFGLAMHSDRNRANVHYAEIAEGVVEGLKENVSLPEDPVLAARLRLGMDWIADRRTILTELGRMMDEDPDASEGSVHRFQHAVMHIAERHEKFSAKDAVAYVRRQRLGETDRRERLAALHHDLNAAINHHRKRYPESTWADVQRALELSAGQVGRKVK